MLQARLLSVISTVDSRPLLLFAARRTSLLAAQVLGESAEDLCAAVSLANRAPHASDVVLENLMTAIGPLFA